MSKLLLTSIIVLILTSFSFAAHGNSYIAAICQKAEKGNVENKNVEYQKEIRSVLKQYIETVPNEKKDLSK